ncbi:MAG TPA: formylglycine-generating enzyme family protein [Thermoanaerobaculaceae bacterium]|jgi:formylglycine-generating enzyme required for sulfatase activity|nr:formylglycine-generating enzyme family protein [Candidatus Nitrosotalea sp.]HVN31719.1 formylglycine-generating enzyme family protein [Thermoanaerobaculaceae bacterium]
MRIPLAVTAAAAVMMAMSGAAADRAAPNMALVPAGQQQPFFVTRGSTGSPAAEADRGPAIEVPAFLMDRVPVTRRHFAEFVRARAEWRRSQVPSTLADSHYLEDWASDLDAGNSVPADAPVTRVSWFAASAYCRWKGRELPTVDQWERAAAGAGKDTPATREKILQWYSRPGSDPLRAVGQDVPNAYGLHDLHGLIWEWTLDFNSTLVSTETRDPGAKDDPLFCGSGSQGAVDPNDYATFMRYALRNSLRASYTTGTLGFRCAQDTEKP